LDETTNVVEIDIRVAPLNLALFRNAASLRMISLAATTALPASALEGWTFLTTVSMPNIDKMGAPAHRGRVALTSRHFPKMSGLVDNSKLPANVSISMPSKDTNGKQNQTDRVKCLFRNQQTFKVSIQST
jgi:hypothetical protein